MAATLCQEGSQYSMSEHGSGVSVPMMLGFLPYPSNGNPDQSQQLQASSALFVPGAAPMLETI